MGGGLVALSKLDEMGRLVAWLLPPLPSASDVQANQVLSLLALLALLIQQYLLTGTKVLQGVGGSGSAAGGSASAGGSACASVTMLVMEKRAALASIAHRTGERLQKPLLHSSPSAFDWSGQPRLPLGFR